ncbi:MAG TPA: cell division protein FtsA [Candidatus Atribacteria bacterium]|nr:cell division protein FtsA [Candidatus Atribacteria bacterium]
MIRNIVTGLDLGTSYIRVVVAEYRTGNKIPKILSLTKTPVKGFRRGYILNFDEALESLQEAKKEAERNSGLKIKRVVLGVGGITLESKTSEGGTVISRADSEITDIDINRSVVVAENSLSDHQNKTIIHRFPLSYKIDSKKIIGQPLGLKGTKLETKTLFVIMASQHYKEITALVEAGGLWIEDVIAAPLASSLSTLNRLQKVSGCVLVDIGSQTTSMVVFEESLPVFLKVLPIGSNDITNDIALGFKIDPREAEIVKLGEKDISGSKKKLEEIIQARLSDIFESVENHLKKLGRSGLLPGGVIITGGGSLITNIEELTKEYFKIPAQLAQENIRLSSKGQIVDIGYSVAYGLCLAGSSSEPEESLGLKFSRETSNKFIKWLKNLWP